MSQYQAIAAVTATLRNMLNDVEKGIPAVIHDVKVSTKPLEKARMSEEGNQINLSLYQILPNAAWANMDMPDKVKSGERGQPPIALDLYYMITPYGRGDDDAWAHQILGKAMGIFHEKPVLGPEDIKQALKGNELYKQIEKIRIYPQNLPLEEFSKFWASAGAGFRLSVVYKISAVLIESPLPVSSALPVARLGSISGDGEAQANLTPQLPRLERIVLPANQPSALMGDSLTLHGVLLGSELPLDAALDQVEVQMVHRFSEQPVLFKPKDRSPDYISFKLPDNAKNLPAGIYNVSARIHRTGDQARVTNELQFNLAPKLLSIDPPTREADGSVKLTVGFVPHLHPDQQVTLIVGDRNIKPDQREETPVTELSFTVRDLQPGDYYLRLRVDGVDSHLLDRTVNPPQFDENKKVTIP